MEWTVIVVALVAVIVVALVAGIVIGARFGRVVVLAALVGVAVWVLVNLPKILEVVGKVQAIAQVLGWGW